jgi:3-oxoadipate enol-lactonase
MSHLGDTAPGASAAGWVTTGNGGSMGSTSVNGIQIAYDDTGGDGPPIVLSHGFLMDRTMFAPQVEVLAPHYRVITWDGRGHGETVDRGAPFSYWDLAADCLGLMDHLAIERAVVGGMSQGGFVSLRVALVAPERVRALILLDTQAGPEDPEVVPLYQAMLDEWVTTGPSDDIADVVAGLIIGEPTLAAEWVPKWRARPHESLAMPGRALVTREDITDRLAEIDAPALVVHGTADLSITMDKAEALAAGLPHCEGVAVIDGGTHAANLTHPGLVNSAVMSFVEGLPA